jgi:hypothetical protein
VLWDFSRNRCGSAGLGGLGRLRGGFGLDFATQSFGVDASTDPVGLGVFDGGRGARGPDAQFLGET